MASIGTATLTIVPKCTGLKSAIESELSKASSTGTEAGTKAGSGFSTGFGTGAARSGAVAGAAAAVANVAIDSISSHVSDAISRFDTLNNYPTVMQSLGYSADEASSSLSKMDEHLQGLPTSLDSMTSTVQGIVAVTGDLDQATEAGLALNDMLLASGSNTQLTSAAMEQFRQILAKGKPDMQDWKSLTSAMPGQMNQLAEAMLGTGATANDLYAALGGGGAEATISTNDLLNAMIKLDNEGADGITSFAEQAKTATGGVQTSMENLGTAITRGLAGTLEAIGKDNISAGFNSIKSAVNDAFTTINSVVSAAMPVISQVAPALASIAGTAVGLSAVGTAASALTGAFSGISGIVGTMGAKFTEVAGKSGALKGAMAALKSAGISPVAVGIAAVTGAIAAGIAVWDSYQKKVNGLKDATTSLTDAVDRTTSLQTFGGRISDIGTSASNTRMSMDELTDAMQSHAEKMQQTASTAESEVAQLNTAQGIIDQYAGVTDLSSEAQGKLAWAIQEVNDQFGLNISAADVANNSYTTQDGNVRNLKESIDQLCESKKNEIKINAMSEELTEAYKAQADAAKGLTTAQDDYNQALEEYNTALRTNGADEQQAKHNLDAKEEALAKAQGTMDKASGTVSQLESGLGDLAAQSTKTADAYQTWVNSLDSGTQAILSTRLDGKGGITALCESLDDLGASVSDLGTLSADQLSQLAADYDGSAASIVDDLNQWGVSMDDSKQKSAEMVNSIRDAVNEVPGMGDVISDTGFDIDQFAQSASDAGLTVQDFEGMSSESFQQLYNKCDGNIQKMIASIALFNSTPLVDKDGNVNVNDSTLIDSQGHIMTYNGQTLYDKTAGAYVDSATVTDSTGVVWEWNGQNLVSKQADATITGNAVTGDAQGQAENTQTAIDRLKDKTVTAEANGNCSDGSAATNIWNTVSAIGSLASRTVDVITNTINNIITNETKNAAGGIRLHASGGIVPRFHANGAIATKAMPLDIVGEDGAEAIVPLTNQKYSQPFVDLIADGVSMKSGAVQAARMVLAALPSIIADNAPNLVIDNDVGRMVVDTRLNQLQRKAAMNRG